jgi:hypothetical protein
MNEAYADSRTFRARFAVPPRSHETLASQSGQPRMETHMATEVRLDQEKVETFVERVVLDVGTAMRGGLLYIGDRLGIFAALAQSGPVTSAELAQRAGLDERYVREWLGAMATAEYVEHDSEGDTYFLAPEHALPLTDEEFPFFTGGLLQMIVPTVAVAPQVAEAFKTGGGVTQDQYLPDMYEAIERLTAPWYKHHLVQTWIPAMPDVQEKLEAGGSACDVGCGSGRAPVTIASAFPAAEVHGYDVHAGSIERARANAQAEGVARWLTAPSCQRASSISSQRSTSCTTQSTLSG